MIKLLEKIAINKKQTIIIANDGIKIETLAENGYQFINKIILYSQFIELAEVRKFINYDRVFYYDEDGKEILLIEEDNNKENIIINIAYKNLNTSNIMQFDDIDYLDLEVNISRDTTKNVALALEIVKKINKYIRREKNDCRK